MSSLSHAGRRMILPLLLERNVWISRDWAPEINSMFFSSNIVIVWNDDGGGSGRRQQSLSDMTAFYCFSEAKTHLHILWNTVRLAHGSKGKRVLFRLILLYLNKKKNRTLWGIKTAGQAAKSDMWSFANTATEVDKQSHFVFSYKRHEWRKDVEQLKE